ncbi:hypothetical protein [Olleya sp. HaHaR_3_96]|uniref:hypothetical protein n=1 Tax=Olleya sp. HaHaR_3_96 TaxID=2745560 RepID=UPI001C4E347E|nr:hypothetical protein [Olleya sp. HaHaR_3_96]QXP58746.1 hypothetical protein H0I26_12590 [Olleya sp. HaHaR_3_96]
MRTLNNNQITSKSLANQAELIVISGTLKDVLDKIPFLKYINLKTNRHEHITNQ